jgi:hypothetical protein
MFLLLRKGQFGEKLEKEAAISYHPPTSPMEIRRLTAWSERDICTAISLRILAPFLGVLIC